MNDLAQHYSLLLGLNEDWRVKHVDLDLARQQVEIRLEYNTQCQCCCPQCGVPRPLKDHAEERTWRHLDTMPFQTPIVARIPSTNCPDCGVLNVHLPWASRCQLPPMVKVVQRIKEHFEQIVTWLTHRISNAPAEGFNSLIQALKSAARGFRNFENYRTRSLIFCGKLKLFPEALRE